MKKVDPLLLLFPLVSLCFLNCDEVRLCNGEQIFSCTEGDRQALLEFRSGLTDPHGLLSSWKDGGDCCQWRGIGCNNETGYVISINLGYRYLFDGPSTAWRIGGELSSSLLKLKYLNYLDLSFNDFRGISVPDFIGSMPSLRYLNLSNGGFGGTIPPQLGNLSSLWYLDLNSFYSFYDLSAASLEWLSRLSSLLYLDMTSVHIGAGVEWFHMINMLPRLSILRLSNCQLTEIPVVLSSNNLTSLAALDLSNNQMSSMLPNWLFNMSSLEHLNLQFNHFRGSIPDAFVNMTSLEVIQLGVNELVGDVPRSIGSLCNLRSLDLSSNNISGDASSLAEISSGCVADNLEILNMRSNRLRGNLSDWLARFKRLVALDLSFNSISGSIPASIGKLSTLGRLFLNHNEFNGTLPESLGQLSELRSLDVSFNSLSGVASEAHFANNSKLEHLSLGSNSLSIQTNSSWIPPFRLRLIGLRLCKLGPKFPSWLGTQKDYNVMDLSSAGIEDDAPDWLWNLSQQVLMLDLSHNLIAGQIPETVKFASISIIDLNSNKFYGPLPPFSSSMEYLDFSNNSFSGTFFSSPLPIISHLLLSDNRITGTIPASICGHVDLFAMDLSSNNLSGELPTCWDALKSLSALNLAHNNLSGEIPTSMGGLASIEALHLGHNRFTGQLPMSLKNCRNLVILDVGENSLSGMIPPWIGESLTFLRILRLRKNMFYGTIPLQLSLVTALQILDLAHNGLSGTIPENLGNFTAMAQTHKPNERMLEDIRGTVQATLDNYGPSGYSESVVLVLKGRELEYSITLQYVASIDLSSNNFTGYIPKELGKLYGLQNLNLSSNHLTGKIPDEIGGLKLLESLDLSWNDLLGSIPGSMSRLTSLSHLNLSYNNFSGRIPSGYQLQTLVDPYIYIGNPQLCGAPLDDCQHNETFFGGILDCGDEEGDCRSEKLWLYIGIIMGFITGFWVICGTLFLSDTIRRTYFRFADRVTDKLNMPCLKRIEEDEDDWDESEEQSILRR